MRMLLLAQISTESGNEALKNDSLPHTLRATLDRINPESTYFCLLDGKRTIITVFDLKQASDLPSIAEPILMAGDVSLSVVPCMTREETRAALEAGKAAMARA
jgi:hypothetical protein